uniref:Uncharacterized protein n=1 Tax=Siphoviridae sp. ctZHD14 TaxID=2827891 RepID=A0A8S5SW36_9CAUD|nr:MAG TPA: hypothetical protein [Siphoviridae sp. ctZHD14]
MYIVNCSWAYDEDTITIEKPIFFKSYQECVSCIEKEILNCGFKLDYSNYDMDTYSYDLPDDASYAFFSKTRSIAEMYKDCERTTFAIHKINVNMEVR